MERTMPAFSQNPSLWHPRQQYGNYQLLKLLGRGGFAGVYLGKHVYLGTRAAIKIVHSLDDFDVQAFFAEARLAAQLRHPHIIRVLDFDLEEGEPFLVMDYAPNGSIRRRYPEGSLLPVSLILDYVDQIADALDYLHSRKLIHRDIKPENLLLDRHNQVLLSDFGITIAVPKAFSGDQVVVGTADYIAPEQIEGRPCTASDQYALGVIVYEWLCGARPFRGPQGRIVQQHLFAQPPSLCERVPDLPSAVEQVVLRALAKNPRYRFESVQDFALELREAFEGQDVATVHDSLPVRPALPYLAEVDRSDSGSAARSQKKSNMQRRKIWREITACYAIDLLVVVILSSVLSASNVQPLLVKVLLALCIVLLPLVGAFVRRNKWLAVLTLTIALAAAALAFCFHALIVFIAVSLALLLLSMWVAFAVSVRR
ncbi:MAG TPA: serine/threonine-protein kinase [Ktedonobacteraceae bacterium]|nr:serine/threonine-protein kinase [Ktedonobacteraceae bacterium]